MHVVLLLSTSIVTLMPLVAALPTGNNVDNAGNDAHPENETDDQIMIPSHFILQELLSVTQESSRSR